MPHITIRPATPADVETILGFIKALAAFEREPDAVKTTTDDLLRDGFGAHPKFETLIAELDRQPVGFALFFSNYSTWEGSTGIYLEDLFVAEHARGLGVGRKLMATLAALAEARDCARLDLAVLDWNPAREFYHRVGMQHMQEWLPYRLSGPALRALAAEAQDWFVKSA
jgi:GNAT superfamily N-acetyltransferase